MGYSERFNGFEKGDRIFDGNTNPQLVRAVTNDGLNTLVRFDDYIFYVGHSGGDQKILAAYGSDDDEFAGFDIELSEAGL
jgi:hypothetical protein